MPEIRFYCPEEKSEIPTRFRAKFGKDWGRRITELMETEICGTEIPDFENPAETIYKRIFGDIKDESEFIADFGRESCAGAVKNRLDTVFNKYRPQYIEIIKLLKERMPKLAALGELT